jgi:hypothetical protein
MLVRDSRVSSTNGAFGRHDRHDSAGQAQAGRRFLTEKQKPREWGF